jgi:hypothetical protein
LENTLALRGRGAMWRRLLLLPATRVLRICVSLPHQ